jgi:hypothetical protein
MTPLSLYEGQRVVVKNGGDTPGPDSVGVVVHVPTAGQVVWVLVPGFAAAQPYDRATGAMLGLYGQIYAGQRVVWPLPGVGAAVSDEGPYRSQDSE